jgi:glucose dehydrogenase
MQASRLPIRFLSLGLILAHLAVSMIHGRAHQGAMVALTMFGTIYVIVVITVAPLVACALLLFRRAQAGALLLALSMLGSLVFGVWYHFLSATNDNVAAVHGPWHSTFLWTAVALASIEFVGVIFGIFAFRMVRMAGSNLQ